VVWIQNTGSVSFGPAFSKGVAPNGTTYDGNWVVYFYNASGQFICQSMECGGIPDTSGGGYLKVTFDVTGASTGNDLVLTYSITDAGQTVVHSISFPVT
jgi:hypothetical protein